MAIRLVKDGAIEPHPDVVGQLEIWLARAKAGDIRSLCLIVDLKDDSPECFVCGEDTLVAATLGEELARQAKLEVLGLM